ncbi:TRM11 family SAM-dependent methyltransferase [Actinomadura sp. 9N407]|uniref:TRM11 family SAM-dependent methyltransferase n=1 Tax=Actinomadura sp. 9N407 TaxID=3375154 RepID=UPI0037A5539A
MTRSWRYLAAEEAGFTGAETAPDQGWVAQMRPLVTELSQPGDVVLDPFAGWGTTLVACAAEGRRGVGLEISEARVAAARRRLARCPQATPQVMVCADSRTPPLRDGTADLCLTNLPYFGGGMEADSSTDGQLYTRLDYAEYLSEVDRVFAALRRVVRPGGYLVVAAENLRLSSGFVPQAWDVARLLGRHFTLGDERILCYDKKSRSSDPLMSNRAHEYLLVAQR